MINKTPLEVEFKIREAKRKNPSASIRSLCREFKLHHKTINRILGQVGKVLFAPATKTETSEITDDTWTITLPRTDIHTLDALLEYCQVDLDVWIVEKFICNKWAGFSKDNETSEITVTPLFQVKAFLRKKDYDSVDDYIKANADLKRRLVAAQRRLKVEASLANKLAENHSGYDDVLANIKEFSQAFGDLKLPKTAVKSAVPKILPAVDKDHTEDAVLLLSDTHFGDVIRKEDTSGFPEFNLTISGNRMGYIINQAKEVLTLHRAMYPIKKLHVWIGGDIGNGELHNTSFSNELNITEQVHFSYHMFKFGIESLLELTKPNPKTGIRVIEEINLLFTVGNHMRLDEKMPYKLQARRTFDWLIYQFLIDRFTNVPNITIKTDMSPFIFEEIRGHRHLFCHGMQVGFKNSPDAQGKSVSRFLSLSRALFDSPEWRKQNNLEGETFSRACIGDIHVPLRFPRFVSNGSLNGQNELGVNWQLEPIPAGQQIFGVSDKHQETWAYFLSCTHIQEKPEDMNAFGLFAQEYKKGVSK